MTDIVHVQGTFWRIWDGTGYHLVSIEDAADEAEARAIAKQRFGVLIPWGVDKVRGTAATRGPNTPLRLILAA